MLRKIISISNKIGYNNSIRTIVSSSQKCGIYEPDYLDSLKSKYPQYECLNFQIKGYDFAILESYQKFLHRAAEYFEFDVSDSFAVPPQTALIQKFKPASSVVETEYKLTTYERVIQINDVDVPKYPLLLRIAQAALPEGVTLNVFQNTEEFEEKRYVPDKDLLELKSQLEVLQGARESAKKK